MPNRPTFKEADSIDRRILKLLQENARLSMTELAERVGLSATPVTERVRRLERDGYISGYHAPLNPARLGPPAPFRRREGRRHWAARRERNPDG